MGYNAKILADSITASGCRLTTMQVTYPLSVHAEFLRHRVFSHSVASARAIPIKKIMKKLADDPVLPVYWGSNKKGMVAGEEIPAEDINTAKGLILAHNEATLALMEKLDGLGLHKQIVNRYAAPFAWVTDIVSGTEWADFFNLRVHPDADPAIQRIAEMMFSLYVSHKPRQLAAGLWHVPMTEDKDVLMKSGYTTDDIRRIAAGRIARVSYETHEGKRDPEADLDLASTLASNKHWSPWEHIARAETHLNFVRNFKGWTQMRVLVGG